MPAAKSTKMSSSSTQPKKRTATAAALDDVQNISRQPLTELDPNVRHGKATEPAMATRRVQDDYESVSLDRLVQELDARALFFRKGRGQRGEKHRAKIIETLRDSDEYLEKVVSGAIKVGDIEKIGKDALKSQMAARNLKQMKDNAVLRVAEFRLRIRRLDAGFPRFLADIEATSHQVVEGRKRGKQAVGTGRLDVVRDLLYEASLDRLVERIPVDMATVIYRHA